MNLPHPTGDSTTCSMPAPVVGTGEDIPSIVSDYLSVVEERDRTIYALSEDNITLKADHFRITKLNEELAAEVSRLRELHHMNERDTTAVLTSVAALHDELALTTTFHSTLTAALRACKFPQGQPHANRNNELIQRLSESSCSGENADVAAKVVKALNTDLCRAVADRTQCNLEIVRLTESNTTSLFESEEYHRKQVSAMLLNKLALVHNDIRVQLKCDRVRIEFSSAPEIAAISRGGEDPPLSQYYTAAMHHLSTGEVPEGVRELTATILALMRQVQTLSKQQQRLEHDRDAMEETIVTQYRLLSQSSDALKCLKLGASDIIETLCDQYAELRGAVFAGGSKGNPFLSAASHMQLEKSKVETLQMINNELREQMVSSSKRAATQRKETAEKFATEKEEFLQEKAKLSDHVATLRNKLSDAIQRENAAKRASKEKETQFNDAVGALRTKVESLLAKLEDTAAEKADLTASYQKAKQQAIEWQNKYDRCQDTLAHTRIEAEKRMEERLARHDREITSMQTRIDELEEDNLESIESLRRAQESLAKFENIHCKQMESMAMEHSERVAEIEESFRRDLDRTVAETSSRAEQEVMDLQTASQNERANLLDEIEALEDRCENLETKLEENYRTVKQLETRCLEKDAEIIKLRESSDISAKISQEEVTLLQGLLDAEKAEVGRLRGELVGAKHNLERTLSRHEHSIASEHYLQRLQAQVALESRQAGLLADSAASHPPHSRNTVASVNISALQTPNTSLIQAPLYNPSSVDQSVMTDEDLSTTVAPLPVVHSSSTALRVIPANNIKRKDRDVSVASIESSTMQSGAVDLRALQRKIAALEKDNSRLLQACEISVNLSAELREQIHRQHTGKLH